MATDATEQTETTLAHHLEAVGLGVLEEILKDDTDQSVLDTQDGPAGPRPGHQHFPRARQEDRRADLRGSRDGLIRA